MMGSAAVCAVMFAQPALAEVKSFDIPAQPARTAIPEFGRQSGLQILAAQTDVGSQQVTELKGEYEPREALDRLLRQTNLRIASDDGRTVTLVQDPQGGSAGGGAEGNAVEALIVTAQKREENIQDVPIAISAFTQESLDQQKIEGGFDLVKAIPNVSFSKTNFTSYNFSIRGVGTKAISATTDPGVSVSFNNTGIIQNRLFEQEYYDLERVEVLRGPQGTLYGRNATSGVINVISAKPRLSEFDGWLKGEVGNFHTKRLSAMVNVPIIEDVLAVRLAGALTDRQGYDFNATTGNAVNGRDLWSARLTVGFEPTERFRGNFIWERFNEDDNRSRTGKQLCHRDDGPEMIGDVVLADGVTLTSGGSGADELARQLAARRSIFSQGCQAGSLYADEAFGTPNGLSYNFILGHLATIGLYSVGQDPDTGESQALITGTDPYGGLMQSRDLREIASIRDPVYRAKADLFELNLDFDVTPSLTFFSQTAYVEDETYSFQDFNRFNTLPVFTDTSNLLPSTFFGTQDNSDLAPGGIFCDPQIGCSDTIAGFDIAQASATQFSQEFRLQSSFEGPLNFSVGANYTEFETLIDYYVFFNMLTAMARVKPFNFSPDPSICLNDGNSFVSPAATSFDDPNVACPFIDPQPIDTNKNFEGEGHNYFRSKNPYKLESWATFGEIYWNIQDDLKLTAGLRYTDDTKIFTQVPSQVLLTDGTIGGGTVGKGYPVLGVIEQGWGEWTGRLVVDWKPDLTLTDETLLYASYSRGYKGGGANPPRPGFATLEDYQALADEGLIDQAQLDFLVGFGAIPVLQLTAVEYGDTFDPEFVDAFEVGAKNTLLGGAMTFNATAFYYDYKDYQVSQIRDRTAVNENFDATVWGVEFETMFAPSRNLQIIANLGYLDTKIADGEASIDIMNRTQSDPNYVVAKPWAQLPSNCVVPLHVAEAWADSNNNLGGYFNMCGGVGGILKFFTNIVPDPVFGGAYDVANYPELNGGAGLKADLGGNELPNAPHWTANIGAQYGFDILDGWRATVRGDVYWQSQSWHRAYNADPYDKLHGWYNANLSLWIERPDDGLKIELYAKNVFDDTPITDAFLNSDDTGLTTNVFVLDPRLIGLSIRKEF